MKYTLHHFTEDMEGNEPENNTSVGEFTTETLGDHEVELKFLYNHRNNVQTERWIVPSIQEAEEKIKTHLARYFKSWEITCDV